MPRRIELTWQPGSAGRQGRWRKKYKGRTLYFPFGSSKSDIEGYRHAMEAWKKKKDEIDAEEAMRPKPHQELYEAALDEWGQVLAWSRENNDQTHAEAALRKIEALRSRLATPKPPPLAWGDRFFDFGLPPDIMDSMVNTIHKVLPWTFPPEDPNAAGVVVPSRRAIDTLDGTPQRIDRLVWEDRLQGQRRRGTSTPNTVEACVTSFLANKRAKVEAKELSAGRYDVLRGHLHHFRDWLGPTLAVTSITAKTIVDYHALLLQDLAANRCSADYAQNRMSAIKTFIRWLWRLDLLEHLPKVLDSKELTISKKVTTPKVFTIAEIKKLLDEATPRTKVYLLLMLNTGMTQKDISDLQQREVDWRNGVITRRRSKTASHESVPTVSYPLWKETFRLLRQERASDGDYVLTNRVGGALKVEELDEKTGKLHKKDNVGSAFARLARATKIEKSLKLLRKTSATLLRGNKQFSGIESLFLGHAPRSISERHYTQAPQEILNEAIVWLGKQYGIE